jgi:hypothetical protein
MNGLLPDGHYFTIHITPEPDFSYVSFETNVPYSQYNEIIRKVVNIFNPGKFTTTIFGGKVTFFGKEEIIGFCFLYLGSNKSRYSSQIVFVFGFRSYRSSNCLFG